MTSGYCSLSKKSPSRWPSLRVASADAVGDDARSTLIGRVGGVHVGGAGEVGELATAVATIVPTLKPAGVGGSVCRRCREDSGGGSKSVLVMSGSSSMVWCSITSNGKRSPLWFQVPGRPPGRMQGPSAMRSASGYVNASGGVRVTLLDGSGEDGHPGGLHPGAPGRRAPEASAFRAARPRFVHRETPPFTFCSPNITAVTRVPFRTNSRLARFPAGSYRSCPRTMWPCLPINPRRPPGMTGSPRPGPRGGRGRARVSRRAEACAAGMRSCRPTASATPRSSPPAEGAAQRLVAAPALTNDGARIVYG